MPIQTECPDCGKKYRFADERAGETVECKECGSDIEIPGGRRRTSGGTKGKKRKKADSGLGAGVLIGGGVGIALILAIAVFVLLKRPAAPPVVPANNGQQIAGTPNSTGVPGTSPSTPATPVAPNTTPGTPNPGVNTNPTTPTTPVVPANPIAGVPKVVPNGPAAGSGFKTDLAGGGVDDGFQPVKDWKVEVDPSPEPLTADVAKDFNIKTVDGYLSEDFVLYPHLPSPFVAVGKNSSGNKDQREVWNLLTGEKTGTIKGPNISGRSVGLSTDGNLIGWFRHQGANGGIELYDIKAKKSLGSVAVDSQKFNVASVAIPNSKRICAASNVHRALISWTLPAGDLEHEIKLGQNAQPDPHWAFSPGGRFVAIVADFLSREINFYDLNTGTKVGVIAFNKRGPDIFGMAFSHDGKEFAVGYASSFSDKAERFVIWKVADGSIESDFTVPNEDKRKTEMLNTKGSLQWFPDGKRLLFNGMHVVDRESQSIVFSFDKQSLDFSSARARRVVSNSVIAAWEGNTKTAAIAPFKISSEDIEKAKAVTAAGGLMFDTKLPKLTAFDRNQARDQSGVAATWSAIPDVAADSKSLGNSIPLKSNDGRPRELDFSRIDSGTICIRMSDEEDSTKDTTRALVPHTHLITGDGRSRTRVRTEPVPCRKNWIDVYSATKKEFIKRLDIPFPCELMAVSPNGERVLVQAIGGEGRLDVFSTDGQALCACRPFQDETDKVEREVASAAFIDNDTIVASSMDDRLIAFKVPSCEPLYGAKDGGTISVSPNGKLLATCAEGAIHIRDALTGDGRGSVAVEGDVVATSFSAKGDRLAALTRSKKGNAVIVIDMKDGTASNVPVPQATHPVVWVGENELLLGAPPASGIQSTAKGVGVTQANMLIDLNRKAVLWTYLHNTTDNVCLGSRTFDGRLWVAGPTAGGNSKLMTAVALPDSHVAKQIGDKKFDAQAIVRPGISLGLTFNVAESAEVKDFSKRARTIIETALKDNNLTVKDKEAITLVVSVSAASPIGPMQLQLFSTGQATQNITVDGKRITLRIAYERGGLPIWESKHDVTNDFFGIQRFGNGETPQAVLDKNMWERVLSLMTSNLPPSHVFSPEASRGLGSSNLTGAGPVPANR